MYDKTPVRGADFAIWGDLMRNRDDYKHCLNCKHETKNICSLKWHEIIFPRLQALFCTKYQKNEEEYYDYCYECRCRGDDCYMDENGELVSSCGNCLYSAYYIAN